MSELPPCSTIANQQAKRKRVHIAGLPQSKLRRVCFHLDELVEVRAYEQVESHDQTKDNRSDTGFPTVSDMEVINVYADMQPLDRADLYQQCCKVYRIKPIDQIARQFRKNGPVSAPFEGPRELIFENIDLRGLAATALADTMGLPLTGKHLVDVSFVNCGLDDSSLRLLLSCLFASANIESLKVVYNGDTTTTGLADALTFLCLSPQLKHFSWLGSQWTDETLDVAVKLLSDGELRALSEFGLGSAPVSEDQLLRLIRAMHASGIKGCALRNMHLTDNIAALLAHLCSSNGFQFIDLLGSGPAPQVYTFLTAISPSSPLLYLDLEGCNLDTRTLEQLMHLIGRLPELRALNLAQSDIRCILPQLKTTLRQWKQLRRINLSSTQLTSDDVVSLCEVFSQHQLSLLVLTGLRLDEAALSTLLALARVCKSLVSLEIDAPETSAGEEIVRKIVAECLRNIGRVEMDHAEAGPKPDSRSLQTAMRQQLESAEVQSRRPSVEAVNLAAGAQGVVNALELLLDQDDAPGASLLPLDLLDRARQLSKRIEPLLEEATDEIEHRRMELVMATLHRVILRFESMYPSARLDEEKYTAEFDKTSRSLHTGRKMADYLPQHTGSANRKSRVLETEEGEIMRMAHQMSQRLNILRSATSSPSRGNSASASRGELADAQEAELLERLNSADGSDLKARLYELQQQGYRYDRPLGQSIE
ncbi:hypothetical protein BCR37DRAFT_390040 [Protomyces lactucae-debilis]|uniref:Uncharacterized protein n=1 Tax=Protomyces lactucae-debilis TaxID=2754530 RepID=A0A1Y2EQ32_PROLT|nr:uncharacterized protein BCR37DRAFT_390040 [Protomyces lactucae-debilis]ORY73703.1 hypothetical protein BCR37DRAFT_390040 [Protomyces lactucae-debilis]